MSSFPIYLVFLYLRFSLSSSTSFSYLLFYLVFLTFVFIGRRACYFRRVPKKTRGSIGDDYYIVYNGEWASEHYDSCVSSRGWVFLSGDLLCIIPVPFTRYSTVSFCHYTATSANHGSII